MNSRFDPVTLSLPGGVARLEPLSAAHAPGLLLAATDPAIWTYIPPPYGAACDRPSIDSMIQQALVRQSAGSEVPFAIIHAPSGHPVGSTRYLDIQPAHRAVEIGATWIGPAWQRSSINTECKYLLLRHAFERLWPDPDPHRAGAMRVQLKCDARNVRSQAAILRIGATFEGVLRRHRVLPDGFVRDTAYFSVVRQEWPGVRRRLEEMLEARRGTGAGG